MALSIFKKIKEKHIMRKDLFFGGGFRVDVDPKTVRNSELNDENIQLNSKMDKTNQAEVVQLFAFKKIENAIFIRS
ncbi:hypothetical protein NQX30_02305 [Candidatus Persebacteraceae bacterium Df01]|uniref:Uncharacterized protein n=1 Tax=Candidatus Doriopsillibacter californiensis TaxID=2970740 RepID=A0ABT7QLB6_9GAMM|nr:hypothetical protein [Candidatus Persebacteraceae bacterium Df01]